MAKAIVKKMKLIKGDAISKRAICDFLEENGVSPLLATDVAMVLRNMYGLTPTFDEGKEVDLIGELRKVLVEDYDTSPRADSPAPGVPVRELARIYEDAVQKAFNESSDPIDELAIAKLSTMPVAEVEQIAMLGEWLSDTDLDQIDECLERGGRPLAEAWFESAARPHLHQFLSERVQHELSEVGADPGYFSSMARMRRRSVPDAQTGPTDSRGRPLDRTALATRSRRQAWRAQGGEDPLASRQAGHISRLGGGADYGGDLRRDLQDPTLHNVDVGARVRREKSRKAAIQNATAQAVARQKEAPANLPADVAPKGPGLGARLKAAGHAALGAVGDVARRAFSGQGKSPETAGEPSGAEQGVSAAPSAEPAAAGPRKPGLFKRMVRGAGRVMKHIGSHAGAAALHHLRNASPAVGYMFGAPGEKEQKYADLLHNAALRKAELSNAFGGARRGMPRGGSAAATGMGRRRMPMNRPRGYGRPRY